LCLASSLTIDRLPMATPHRLGTGYIGGPDAPWGGVRRKVPACTAGDCRAFRTDDGDYADLRGPAVPATANCAFAALEAADRGLSTRLDPAQAAAHPHHWDAGMWATALGTIRGFGRLDSRLRELEAATNVQSPAHDQPTPAHGVLVRLGRGTLDARANARLLGGLLAMGPVVAATAPPLTIRATALRADAHPDAMVPADTPIQEALVSLFASAGRRVFGDLVNTLAAKHASDATQLAVAGPGGSHRETAWTWAFATASLDGHDRAQRENADRDPARLIPTVRGPKRLAADADGRAHDLTALFVALGALWTLCDRHDPLPAHVAAFHALKAGVQADFADFYYNRVLSAGNLQEIKLLREAAGRKPGGPPAQPPAPGGKWLIDGAGPPALAGKRLMDGGGQPDGKFAKRMYDTCTKCGKRAPKPSPHPKCVQCRA
jgi:hypothetical protein